MTLVPFIVLTVTIRRSATVLVCALVLGGAGLSIRQATLSHNALHRAIGESAEITAVVTSDPTWGRASVKGANFRSPSISFLARVESARINGNNFRMRLPVRVISREKISLHNGEKFLGEAKILATREKKVAALLILSAPPQRRAEAPLILRGTTSLRARFSELSTHIAGESGELIPGLVLGDTSRERPDFIADMRRTGLTHLTAVSGANFAIIASTMLWLSQWIFRRRSVRILATAVVLLGFIFLVRPSPSVLRASVMTAVLLIAQIRGSRSNALASLGLAISLLILLDPFQALDAGFALSVAATAGILILSPRISVWLINRGAPQAFAEFLAIPLSATALCTPIIVAISGQLSLVSIPANLLVALVVAPITIGGFIAALLPFSQLAHLLLVAINPCAQWIVVVARKGAGLPVLLLPSTFLGILLVLAGIAFALYRRWKYLIALLVSLAIVMYAQSLTWPGKNWAIVNCDVGQGDGLAINLGKGRAIVIDAGPDPILISRCLRALHIHQIPLLVLTHFHADHVAGLSGILKTAKVESVWVSNSVEPAPEYARTLTALASIPITVVHQGQRIAFPSDLGPVKIDVWWPGSETDTSINNSSVALYIEIHGLRIFAAGDIEPPAQEAIMKSGMVRPVDILKVAHHGSRYQDYELMDALAPQLALISVGAGNSYGHPSPETLAALTQRHIRVRRSDQDGAIASDARLRIRTNKREWWRISWG